MGFEGLVGNQKTKELLSSLLEAGRFPHAIILEGDEGLGKRTLALEIALSLVCKSEDSPCRKCAQCSKVLKHLHPDVITYTGSGKSNAISVDTVREVISEASVKPNEADYKILILEECTNMLVPAQNALLKILEEPPEYIVLILCAKTKSIFLETVLSRSVVFTLDGVDIAEGALYICNKNEDADYEEAQRALSICNGNIGKALETLDDGRLKKIVDIANDLSRAMVKNNEYELLKACSVFERDNQLLISTLTFLKSILRDAALYESGAPMLSNQKETASLLSKELGEKMLIRLINVCDEISAFAKGSGNNAILITKLCYELRRAQGR
jgi:DNA polymerase-3 subunit delta'